MAVGVRGPNPNLQETTAMKTAITSKITLLNILRSRSTLIFIALGFMVFVFAQRTQAVDLPPDGDNADFGNTTVSNVMSSVLSSARPLPTELLFSSIQMADLAR